MSKASAFKGRVDALKARLAELDSERETITSSINGSEKFAVKRAPWSREGAGEPVDRVIAWLLTDGGVSIEDHIWLTEDEAQALGRWLLSLYE